MIYIPGKGHAAVLERVANMVQADYGFNWNASAGRLDDPDSSGSSDTDMDMHFNLSDESDTEDKRQTRTQCRAKKL